ncbi:tetratricopeptide repeat protein [Allosphingosinicella sp.]|uniref:tetratricopeptide repeat protein n=1 Tax=Allosphingosinicella sp. TaxID=2823234 RepID=UPI003D724443
MRGQRLRVAGAALLARRGKREQALALVAGEGAVFAAARRLIQARRTIPGEIATARAGVAEFLARLSIELNSQEAAPIALSFARIATFLAPENSEASLIVAELLLAQNRHSSALAAVGQIGADDPFWVAGRDLRIRILHGAGRRDEAVALARSVAESETAGVGEWRRLGDLYLDLERDEEAVAAYRRAIALAGDGSAENPLWALLLPQAAALERSGDWPAAKAALERARALAPDQPQILNDLGYLQLDRRENVEEATRLVAEAHRLAPDSAAITDSLGWAYYLQGDLPRAIDLLERAAQREPADPEINEHLGDAYYRAGRRIEARFAWRAALVYAEEESAARLRAKIESGLAAPLAAR